MSNKLPSILAIAAGIITLILFPVVHATVLVVNFAVHLAVLGLQVVTSRMPRVRVPRHRSEGEEPFVSIHVPAHNEPPEVLKETLRSLKQLSWRNYEVLVIDNNTSDESLWKPVEEYCRTLGPQFRFLHVEGIKGAKAGAMNWARQFMDPRAEFIFVVDADYVVERRALRKAVSCFTDSGIGLVQFPQEYRNIGPSNLGLALDFKHFFAGYMTMANRLGCVPSTGTLSMIRVSALETVNGFDTQVVTEDAELGFRLNKSGFRSVYSNEVIGRGLMPHDLESLKKQRWRWAFGNAQILKLNWRALVFGRDLSMRQKLGYLAHLTAWFNFNLIPTLTLILLGPLVFLNLLDPLHPYMIVLSWLTLVTFNILRFATLYYSLRQDGHTLREIVLAFLTHSGMGWIFSASWIKCLFNHRLPFVRTNKFLTRRMPRVLGSTAIELTLGLGLLATCAALIARDFLIAPIGMMATCIARFLIYWVWWQTRATWKLTSELGEQARRSLVLAEPIESETTREFSSDDTWEGESGVEMPEAGVS